MTIGQLAQRVGLTPRAVRFYEAEGVLPRAARAASGYRVYGQTDLDVLRLIAGLRAAGLALTDIREIVRLRNDGIPPPDRIIALHTRVVAVDRDIDTLQRRRGALLDVLEPMLAGGQDARLCRVLGTRG